MLTNIPGRPSIDLPAFYPSFAWYYPNCELQTKAWFVRHAGPDWTYLDCGANIGYYSILFSQLSPHGHIHAFEPTVTYDMLETNLHHHGCSNVTAHRLAFGRNSGRRKEKVFRLWGQPPEEMEYEFSTVDLFVAEHGLNRVDCLKIDVDSFDFEVLQGAEETLSHLDPWLVVELNHALSQRGQNNLAALDWLVARGYKHSLVLDHDNFILRRSAPPATLATDNNIVLNFPLSK